MFILDSLSTESSPEDNGGYSAEQESIGTPETPISSKTQVHVSSIPKLVDNKRKHMEKCLSQAQRDQFLMSNAKDDAIMKKDMLRAFEKSNKTLEDAISKMTDCLTTLGNGIAQAMQMFATAMSNPNPTPAHNVQMHYNGNIQHHISQPQYHPGHYEASSPENNEVSSPYYHSL